MNYEDMTDDITTKTLTSRHLTADEIIAQAFAVPVVPNTPTTAPSADTIEAPLSNDEDEAFTVSLELTPPEHGRSLLMPNSHNLNGRAVWEPVDSRNLEHKLRRALRAGLVRRGRFLQPIDIVMVMAGTQATNASEKNGVEGDLVRGMMPRQIQTALKIQSACGKTTNTTGEPRDERPTGVAIVSVLSDADHRAQITSLTTQEFRRAVNMATKGRTSQDGPLQPVLTDAQGRIQGIVVGEGISLFPMSTAKDGGGKSVTAYARTSPRQAIDRQHELFSMINTNLQDSANPIVIPPVISIGGTSIDAYLAFIEDQSAFIPRGAYQYVTTTAQDHLSVANAVDATRKKLQTVVLMTCTNQGKAIADIPVVLLDMDEGAVKDFVDCEALRLALEKCNNLQTASGMDRSDVLVRMDEHVATIGRGTAAAKLRPSSNVTEDFQHRDVFLSHAMSMNRNQVIKLASGRDRGEDLGALMQKLTSRAFAQAYGREHGEINLRDEELHRAKFKMAHIVAYVPEDMSLLESEEAVLQFEDALSKGLMAGIGDHRTRFPVLVTTYRVPMDKQSYPIIGVRFMVHAKDIFDLLCADTPELWGRILTGISIEEMNENRMGRTVVQENHKFRHEIKALRSEANREVPVLSKWADGLDRFMAEIYGDWARKNPEKWNNALGKGSSSKK
jgi:hypothetical protein